MDDVHNGLSVREEGPTIWDWLPDRPPRNAAIAPPSMRANHMQSCSTPSAPFGWYSIRTSIWKKEEDRNVTLGCNLHHNLSPFGIP
jgi:hypothetical protein